MGRSLSAKFDDGLYGGTVSTAHNLTAAQHAVLDFTARYKTYIDSGDPADHYDDFDRFCGPDAIDVNMFAIDGHYPP